MPFTPRMKWAYPGEDLEPWYDALERFINLTDRSAFAARDDRHTILVGGGVISFDSTSGLLEWASDLQLTSPISGFRNVIPAGSVQLEDGELFYVNVVRAPEGGNNTCVVAKSTQVPSTDDAMIIAFRNGSCVYLRNGQALQGGTSIQLCDPAGTLSNAVEVIPSPKAVEGTTPHLIGHVRLQAGTVAIRTVLGSDDVADTATLTLRRETDASIVTSITPGAAIVTETVTTGVVIPAADQYYFTLESDNAAGIAICTEIKVE